MANHNPPPAWIFALTSVPYGVSGGFAMTTMPFITRRAGLSLETIGWYGAALAVPPVVQFLYAPLVDTGLLRKQWLVLVSAASALCLGLALTMPVPSQIGAFLGLAFAGQAISGLVSSCNGGLIATLLPSHLHGRAAGYSNVGNLAGGALGAWLTLGMAERTPASWVGGALALLMILPALAALTLHEPERRSRSLATLLAAPVNDVAAVLRTSGGLVGLLVCLSPVGTVALLYYFSALAPDYHASARLTALVNGPMNGLLTAIGSLVGGYLCDRGSRRRLYLAAGLLTALCDLGFLLAPMTESSYAVAVGAYLLVGGFAYSAFSAFVLEVIGSAERSASTRYALYASAGNAAIAYVGWLDTRVHARFGPRGLAAVDATLNLCGVGALALVLFWLARTHCDNAIRVARDDSRGPS